MLHTNISLTTCPVILLYHKLYSKMVILTLFPEVMNSITVKTYSKSGFTYHNHVTSNYLTDIVNAFNKL